MEYLSNTANIHDPLHNLNNFTPLMQYTIKEESENKINILDITIAKDEINI
jgi:hypothetical protein